MKRHSKLIALIIATFLVGSPVPAFSAQHEPLQNLAGAICAEGSPFPTSKLFELFELEVPFLILTEGPEMLAAQAVQCRDFQPVEAAPFFLVLGHRNTNGTATFYVTSLRGDLIHAARGLTSASGDSSFDRVELTNEIRVDFEAAKAFWLTWCGLPLP